MPTGKPGRRRGPRRRGETKPAPKVFFGSYMPFAGVRYYTLLDEHDVAKRRNRIGAVGWNRDGSTSTRTPAQTAA